MPTKRRRIQAPRQAWRLQDLGPNECLALRLGWDPKEDRWEGTRFQCLADVKVCWDALREHFLAMKQDFWHDTPGVNNWAGHEPGERPWAWWKWEVKVPLPLDQPRWLRRHGMLSPKEEGAIATWDREVRDIGYRDLLDCRLANYFDREQRDAIREQLDADGYFMGDWPDEEPDEEDTDAILSLRRARALGATPQVRRRRRGQGGRGARLSRPPSDQVHDHH